MGTKMGENSKTPLTSQHQPSPSKERAEYAELMFKVSSKVYCSIVNSARSSLLYHHFQNKDTRYKMFIDSKPKGKPL